MIKIFRIILFSIRKKKIILDLQFSQLLSSIRVIHHNIFKACSLNVNPKCGSNFFKKKNPKIATFYQATIMDEFMFDNKSCTAYQLIDACVFDDRNKIITAIFHFMKATCITIHYTMSWISNCSANIVIDKNWNVSLFT